MGIETTVFDRSRGIGGFKRPCYKNQVCSFWLVGKCNRNPCRFLHSGHGSNRFHNSWRNPTFSDSKNVRAESSTGGASLEFNGGLVKQKKVLSTENPGPVVGRKNATVPTPPGTLKYDVCDNLEHQRRVSISERHGSVVESKKVRVPSSMDAAICEGKDEIVDQKKVLTLGKSDSAAESPKKSGPKLCQYRILGNCVHGDKCKDLHSWFLGSGFSLLANLEMQNKAVIGIALPNGFDKLFSGSKDGSAFVWDCNTGQCVRAVQLESEIGCMISESPWVFVGLRNAVKAWNIETRTEIVLTGPNGLVNAMDVGDDILFAGVEDGSILAWKSSSEARCPQVLATLKGHTLAVISLIVGAGRLYSGSKDGIVRVWDLKTLECLETLNAHCNYVTSLICWDRFLFSGSLDKTVKVWGATESGSLEVTFEIKQESGILALCGIHDGDAKPILLCSCEDNTVGMLDLPSFAERGRIFSTREVLTIAIGCGGLFFTGDASGQLCVWRLH